MSRMMWGVGCVALSLVLGCTTGRPGEEPSAQEPARERAVDAVGGAALDEVNRAAAAWPSSGFASSRLWDDGKAEVAKYDATRSRYGALREFEMTVIHVKESFDAKKLVKSDWPDRVETIPVIKSNVVFEMPTQNYPYSMSSGTFVRSQNPSSLVKLTTTSHEWCGITTKSLDLKGEAPKLDYRSYFDAEGEGTFDLSGWPTGGMTREQLIFAVRDLAFEQGLELEIAVLSRQLESHARAPSWSEGKLVIVGQEQAEDARGVEHQVWRIEARLGSQTLVYLVGVEAPHLLVRYEGGDGETMRLKDVTRWAYWDLGQPAPF